MIEESIHEIPVMEESSSALETHMLLRGMYDAPKSKETLVSRATTQEIGPPLPSDAPNNRLGLAAWLTNPNHPLTARVAVNRLWANFFGQGLSNLPRILVVRDLGPRTLNFWIGWQETLLNMGGTLSAHAD